MFPCMARLRNSEKNTFIGNSMLLVYAIKNCSNKCEVDGGICKICSALPLDSTPSMKLIHGNLKEPLPVNSRIYGSAWYWKHVKIHGEPADKKWIALAQDAQRFVEDKLNGHKLKAPVAPAPPPSAAPAPLAPPTPPVVTRGRKKVKIESVAAPVMSYITPLAPLYLETDDPIEKLPTDSYRISIQEVNGEQRYVCENGMIFSIEKDEPGAFLGRI